VASFRRKVEPLGGGKDNFKRGNKKTSKVKQKKSYLTFKVHKIYYIKLFFFSFFGIEGKVERLARHIFISYSYQKF